MSDCLLYAWLPDAPIHLDAQAEGEPQLLWKVVLRTGTWKLRPGPGGVKLNQPLKIYRDKAPKGHISMAELVKNFDAGAKEYVTIPQVHADGTTSDGGFVKKLVIQDVPGEDGSKAKESLLWAGLEITDSALKTKLDEKSIRGVSGGILFDYERTEDAKKFGQILSHVMVTNSPWINGTGDFQAKLPEGVMASEPDDLAVGEVEFSSRETDPLPQLPVVHLDDLATSSAADAYSVKPSHPGCSKDRPHGVVDGKGKLIACHATMMSASEHASTGKMGSSGVSMAEGDPTPVSAGKVLWKPEQGFRFAQDRVSKALRDWRDALMSSLPVEQRYTVDWPYFHVDDVSLSGDSGSALISSGYGADCDAWVAAFKLGTDNGVELDPFVQWRPAKQEWVAAADEQEALSLSVEDLDGLLLADVAAQRKQWAKDGKALPDGSWPIPDASHLSKAIQAWPGRAQGQESRIKAWILKRARALGVPDNSPLLSRLRSGSASATRSSTPSGGGSAKMSLSLSHLGLREAQAKRAERASLGTPSTTTGGNMPRLSELLSGVELSDEQREAIQAEEARLARFEEGDQARRERERQAEVAAYCGTPDGQTPGVLDKIGLGDPGVKKYVRNALLSDDGGPAIELSEHLDDGRRTQGESKTATDLLKGFIDILPKETDSGRVSLAEQARRMPDDPKPAITSETEDGKLDLSDEAVKKRADDLAAEMMRAGFGSYTKTGGDA